MQHVVSQLISKKEELSGELKFGLILLEDFRLKAPIPVSWNIQFEVAYIALHGF